VLSNNEIDNWALLRLLEHNSEKLGIQHKFTVIRVNNAKDGLNYKFQVSLETHRLKYSGDQCCILFPPEQGVHWKKKLLKKEYGNQGKLRTIKRVGMFNTNFVHSTIGHMITRETVGVLMTWVIRNAELQLELKTSHEIAVVLHTSISAIFPVKLDLRNGANYLIVETPIRVFETRIELVSKNEANEKLKSNEWLGETGQDLTGPTFEEIFVVYRNRKNKRLETFSCLAV